MKHKVGALCSSSKRRRWRIVAVIPSLARGGAERVFALLTLEWEKWFDVVAVVFDGSRDEYTCGGKLVDFKASNWRPATGQGKRCRHRGETFGSSVAGETTRFDSLLHGTSQPSHHGGRRAVWCIATLDCHGPQQSCKPLSCTADSDTIVLSRCRENCGSIAWGETRIGKNGPPGPKTVHDREPSRPKGDVLSRSENTSSISVHTGCGTSAPAEGIRSTSGGVCGL